MIKVKLVKFIFPEDLSSVDLTIGKIYETDGNLQTDEYGSYYSIVDDAGFDNILYTTEVEIVE